jgi:CRP/FNR family transcriptional regulator, cyclic AMP receptor protein
MSTPALNPQDVLQMLNRLPIFASLSNEDAHSAVQHCQAAFYPAGHVLFREGQRGDSLALVIRGTVRVTGHAPDGVDVELAILRDGAMVGEMNAIDPMVRAATATAVTDTIALIVAKETLDELIATNHPAAPQIMRTILESLCQRYRAMYARIDQVFSARLSQAAKGRGDQHGWEEET